MIGNSTGFNITSKPKALMCSICGREFGTNSLEIHMKQCEKKNGNKSKIADDYNKVFDKIRTGERLDNNDYEEFNNNANNDYKENSLFPCQNCGRRFLPDRLEVHLRSCKGDGKEVKFKVNPNPNLNSNVTDNPDTKVNLGKIKLTGGLGKSVDVSQLNSGKSTKLFEERMMNQLKSEEKSSKVGVTPESKRGNSVNPNTLSKSCSVLPPIKPKGPVFLVCYVCGREFGKHSIEIHLEKCMEKHVQEEINRGVPKKKIITPEPPQELIDILDKLQVKEEPSYEEIVLYNQIAQEWYKNLSLKQCEKCGRKFAADRLDVHLKSCNPEQIGSSSYKKTGGGMASRPRMLMCPLCGREFGSLSLDIHMKTCEVRFNREQEQLPRNQRRNAEDIIEKYKQMNAGIKKGDGNYNVDNYNNEAYKIFSEDALVPCDLCGRTFLPDRLLVHQRSCKGPRK